MTDPLDDLLTDALIQQNNSHRTKRALATKHDWDANYRASFKDPANWLLASQVELIHVEGNVHTLIGLYDELLHKTVPKCRRLVASSKRNEALPFSMEHVQGDLWLPSQALLIRRQPTERTVEVIWNLELDLGQALKAELVICRASLVGGGLQRLCLMQETLFEGNTPRTVLQLPAGLDVLEALSLECKKAIWNLVRVEENHE